MIYINLLLIVLVIITVHEFGHYLAARLFNAEVTEFSIGFGKTLYQYLDKNNTNWKISILPLGGYVKIKGLDSIFQKNQIKNNESGTFQSLSLIKQIIILLAGSFFNILSVVICLSTFIFFVGYKSYTNEVGDINKDSSAEINDIRKGDKIISINNIIIKDFNDLIKNIGNEENIIIKIDRNNILLDKNIKLNYDNNLNKYLLGISNSNNFINYKYNFTKSISNSIFFIPNFYKQFFYSLNKSFKNETLTKELAGPIGIVKNADKLMLNKFSGIINMFILFSLSIGMLNLLPIPLLDGGHIVYFIVRDIFSNSLPHIITRIYIATGITIISFMFFMITFNDIFYK